MKGNIMENIENQETKVEEKVETPQPGLSNDEAKAIREATEAKLLRKLGFASIEEAQKLVSEPAKPAKVDLTDIVTQLKEEIKSEFQANNAVAAYVQEGVPQERAETLVKLQGTVSDEEFQTIKQSFVVKDTAKAVVVTQQNDTFDPLEYSRNLAKTFRS